MSMRNGTRRCWATETMAAVLPESNEPISICAPWVTTRSASTRPFSGFVCVSPTMSSSFTPFFVLMPPAAFTASTAIWAPSRQAWPGSASGPVTGCTAPILNVLACARSVAGALRTAAPATAVLRKVRRSSRLLIMSVSWRPRRSTLLLTLLRDPRQHVVDQPLVLLLLLPAGDAQRERAGAVAPERAQVLDALGRRAGRRPCCHHRRREDGPVVRV